MFRFLVPAGCAAGLLLAGCISESRSPSGPVYAGDDTSTIGPDGTRKPDAPRVSYRTRDSVVSMIIVGWETGNNDWYWIYRDGRLLPRPVFLANDSGLFHFHLDDTLRDSGSYAYTARYGYRVNALGPKSPAFTYDYPGRSPSGSVSLSPEEGFAIRIRLHIPPRTAANQARFERRTGRGGSIVALDTIPLNTQDPASYRDTAFVPYDTVLYYRAALRDAGSDAWLAPTAWDSIRIHNQTWDYVPRVAINQAGNGVQARVSNPLYDLGERALHILYRGRKEARAEGTACDSLPVSSFLSLQDAPGDTGTWYYWIEARDSRGRASPRSAPTAFRFTGAVPGPRIASITTYPSGLAMTVGPLEYAVGYILQRAADTADVPSDVDTLDLRGGAQSPAFTDAPPGNGYWSYRALAVPDSGDPVPGPWYPAVYFRRVESYAALPVPIRNLGPRGIAAEVTLADALGAVLYRSARPDGADSAAVDTLRPDDPEGILRDTPDAGTWHYRIYRSEKPSHYGATLSRTAWTRIDYTGKAVGPAIQRLEKLGTGIDAYFEADPGAIAFIIERSPDGEGDWTVIDTLSVDGVSDRVYSDHPPRDGNWYYRARTLASDLSRTDPGPVLGTGSPWVFRVVYDNSLRSTIHNRGDRVECPLTTSASYGYYLKRSAAADYSGPILADSSRVGEPDGMLADAPPKGIWYYWAERRIPAGENSGSILRSVPVRVDVMGAPEATALTRVADGIQLEYPKPGPGDTLEIWRSAGEVRDSASYTRVWTEAGNFPKGWWIDPAPDPGKTAFYHYRLAFRSADRYTGPGPAKTYYYVPQ